MLLETEPIPNSCARILTPRIKMILSEGMYFQYKGKLLENNSVFSRVGVAIEGPNEVSNLSPKFGLESDEHGQFSQLVVADGITRMTLGIPVSVKQN